MDAEMSETVYGTPGDDSHVMSEKVQSLASSVYSEFERMIKKYDEDVVKELMPLLVGILENLDQAFQEKQENEVDLELLRDDNEQLLTQYEREKQLRKAAEQKNLELEDVFEEERKDLSGKLESLESIVRMFELKAKNAQDHIVRLEDKEAEMKKEYTKLHERYTELFKTHMDYIERTKLLMGPERMLESGNSPRGAKGGLVLPNLRPVNPGIYSSGETPTKGGMSPSVEYGGMTPNRAADANINLHQEFRDLSKVDVDTKCERGQTTDTVTFSDRSTATSSDMLPTPDMEDFDDTGYPAAKNSVSNANTSSIFEELSANDHDALGEIDDGVDITGRVINPGDFASSGMSKEVENLILENTELLATKNALNVVKDDLIAKVDELGSEQEILKEEIISIQAVKEKLKKRISELEEDLKRSREDLEAAKEKAEKAEKSGDQDDVPMAQRKRFTRVEMARVLMERNQYKERLMELQEAVRWTEMIRASREHPELASTNKKKGSIWNFFSNLFSSSDKPKKKKVPTATLR